MSDLDDIVSDLRSEHPSDVGRWHRANRAADEIDRLLAQLASARKAVEEMESYRLALAWIEGQSTDPKARELAADALRIAETDEQREGK